MNPEILVLIVDDKCIFKQHISSICSKAYSTINVIIHTADITHIIDYNAMVVVYNLLYGHVNVSENNPISSCHFDLTATALGATLRRMEDCLDVVEQWMTSNSLCMNDSNTEYLPVVPKTAAAFVVDSVIRVGDATITASR